MALALAAATPLQAQRGARLQVELPPRGALGSEGPTVRSIGVLLDREIRSLLRSGFPARLHFRVELWSDEGWLNDLEASTEWDVIVRQDALDGSIQIARVPAEGEVTVLGRFASLAAAEEALARPFRAPVAPRSRRGRHYYTAVLDVQILSLSDLDEVERWLRGELRPAVRAPANVGTALTRGVRTLMVRLLGGERRHFEARTPTFRP